MRLKLIAIFSVVVLLVGGLSYVVVLTMMGGRPDPAEATRALTAASAQLQVEGLATERWIIGRALDEKVRQPFSLATPDARGAAATEASNRVRDQATTAPELPGIQPALVAIVDEQGMVLGRNGSQMMRGDNLGKVYPSLVKALTAGLPGSDLWVDKARNEQMFASYAPIRGEDGKLLGGLVVATLINDERLTSASNKTSGEGLLLAIKDDSGVHVVARSAGAAGMGGVLEKAGDTIGKIMETGQSADIAGFPHGAVAVGKPLEGYGNGRRAAIVAVAAPKGGGMASKLMLPILGITALGIVMVIIFASLLDQWVSRPIQEIEDGLLAIINGKTDLRFELEHPLYGGLAFRINSLLNQLFGVQEDETDEQGRVVGGGAPQGEPAAADSPGDGGTESPPPV